MGDVNRILVVTGTQREASILRLAGVEAIAIGGSSSAFDAALASSDTALAAVISFGMGGALGPDLRLGDWVIGTGLCGAVDASCDPAWIAALTRDFPAAQLGTCYADGRLIGNYREKQALYQNTGAIFADMESHIVAACAARLGIGFAILRCISDEAYADLPPAIAVAMKPDGALALGAVLASILTQPGQIPQLIRTITRFNHAFAVMRQGIDRFSQRLSSKLR